MRPSDYTRLLATRSLIITQASEPLRRKPCKLALEAVPLGRCLLPFAGLTPVNLRVPRPLSAAIHEHKRATKSSEIADLRALLD